MRKLTVSSCLILLVFLGVVGKSFALPSCPSSGAWSNCFGSWTFDKGDKYVGEWRDDKPHGQGTYTFGPSSQWAGDKYVGEFRDGEYHGQGTYYYLADNQFKGDKYVGEYRDGKYHGHGTYTYANGDKYVGEWRDGKQNGQGTNTWANGNKYVGEHRDGKKRGQGTFTYADGHKYVGEFRNDKRNGQGTLTFGPSSQWAGDKYVGEFKDDKFHGQGTYTFADGSVYEGIWKNDNFLYAKKLTPTVPEKKPTVTGDPNKLVTAASGSGFAVSSSGHVITNNHVIHGCSDVKIHHDGRTTKARIIAHDSHNDLALLKGNFTPSTVLPLSRDNPQLLQEIYVAGFPFGKKISSSIKVTKGIVSSLMGLENNVSNIQIDAALQPGNSGGPVIDGNGNVVAVAVAKLDLMTVVENWGVVPENTNFGVKSTIVVNLLQSNNVKLRAPNTKTVSTTTLGKTMSDATYYLSCWMTMAQIEQMRTQKVMFSSFD